MKKHLLLISAFLFMIAVQTASAQKYKTVNDTIKLNKEYLSVSEDIADLTKDLAAAKDKLPGYQRKASDKTSDARKGAVKSNEQSSKAIDGDVGDARKAKRKANNALKDAQNMESANNKVGSQEKKIAKLESQLQKKQDRLQQLEEMRVAIRTTIQ